MFGRGRSIISLAVAVALLGAQGSTALHLLLVEHEICPEHGELIEGGGRPANGARALTAPSGPALERMARLEAHQHDQCLALVGQRDGAPPPAALQVVVPVNRSAHLGGRADGAAASRGPPLYRLAPKNSPPV